MNPWIVAALWAGAWLIAIAAWLNMARAFHAERREHARERQLLTNQILHLSGKPWESAPAAEKPEPEPQRPYLVNPNRIPAE